MWTNQVTTQAISSKSNIGLSIRPRQHTLHGVVRFSIPVRTYAVIRAHRWLSDYMASQNKLDSMSNWCTNALKRRSWFQHELTLRRRPILDLLRCFVKHRNNSVEMPTVIPVVDECKCTACKPYLVFAQRRFVPFVPPYCCKGWLSIPFGCGENFQLLRSGALKRSFYPLYS